MILGITGTDGAGKGTVVDYLVHSKNFTHCSARAIWEQEFLNRGIESSRVNMRLVANEMRAQFGNDFLVTYYLKKIVEENLQDVVIESIRTIDEVKTLKAHGGLLLAVDADQNIRYSRIQSRASSSDNVSLEEFIQQEQLEMNDPNPHGMQKAKVMESADYTIVNNISITDLVTQTEFALKKMKKYLHV